MPLQQTSGNVTADAYGGGVAAAPLYIEDFFQTYLRTGTGASASVTTGLNGSTKETLVWTKSRSAATDHKLTDNVRGATKALSSNTTGAEATDSQGLTAFNATGYTIGTNTDYNNSGATYVDWQWVSQPKFFDVVTYTGTGSNRTIAHNLGSVPGCIIVKRTDTAADWAVYHRSLANTEYLVLNTTAAKATGATWWNSTTPTSTVFSLGTDASVNASGGTYVAYIYAHDSGGFGLTGTDNVISCGSYTATGNDPVELGWEPQWILTKRINTTGNWAIDDTMRGFSLTGDRFLNPNLSDAESAGGGDYPTATGFVGKNYGSGTIIYIAIRRGPMKVPTLGTSVFAPVARTGSGTNPTVVTTGNNPDLLMSFPRTESPASYGTVFFDKLRGVSQFLQSANTNAEATTAGTFCLQSFLNTGFQTGADFIEGYLNYSGATYAQYAMTRAPGFFDEVCYSGTGAVGNAVSHNLGVAPELAIFKGRAGTVGSSNWSVFTQFTGTNYVRAFLQLTDAGTTFLYTNNAGIAAAPTSTTITVDNVANVNNGSTTYVAYLFATCPGVSKVGTYTGNGTTQTINCGFTAGARFVLIKATSTTGNWMVFDTSRGMTVLTDPFLSLNSTAAETATLGACTTVSTGFAVNESILAGVNTSSVSFVFLAVA